MPFKVSHGDMARPNCYNNVAFNGNYDRRSEPFNNVMEVAAYQAVNETFVDDEGEEYVDLYPQKRHSYAHPLDRPVGYHREPRRKRHESTDEAYPEARRKTFVDLVEEANEEYVDFPEDRLGLGGLEGRVSPLGCSGSLRYCEITPTTTPKKLSRQDSIVLAPILAQMERRQAELMRSRSILGTPPKVVRRLEAPLPRRVVLERRDVGRSLPSLVTAHYSPAKQLRSFDHILGSTLLQTRTPNRRPNTAVSMHPSLEPLKLF